MFHTYIRVYRKKRRILPMEKEYAKGLPDPFTMMFSSNTC